MGRRELTGVAGGLLGSFISRNNDVDGYWALGQLRSECDARCSTTLTLDILAGTASPDGRVGLRVAMAYRDVLSRLLQGIELGPEHLRSARVLLDFAPPPSTRVDPHASYGSPFACVVRLEDPRGHAFRVQYAGRCRAHNPDLERRSARA